LGERESLVTSSVGSDHGGEGGNVRILVMFERPQLADFVEKGRLGGSALIFLATCGREHI
jgi:hypothetical protein